MECRAWASSRRICLTIALPAPFTHSTQLRATVGKPTRYHHAQTRFPTRTGPHIGGSGWARSHGPPDLRYRKVSRTASCGKAHDSIAISGNAARDMIRRQFIAFDPRYLEQKRRFAPQITAAAAEIREHEEWGRSLPCSTQIYLEAKWLLNYTAYFEELRGMLEFLQRQSENRGSKLRQLAIAC